MDQRSSICYSQNQNSWMMESSQGQAVINGMATTTSQLDNNCRIFVAGIPRFLSNEEVEETLKMQMPGIQDFELIMLTDTSSKGFGFIQMENRASAVQALDAINRGLVRVGEVYINGSWAKPEHYVPDEVMDKVDGIFVSNLAMKTDRTALEKFFGGKNNIYRVVKHNNCAFIHFRDKDEARRAVKKFNKTLLDGSRIIVKLAKPPPSEKQANPIQFVATNPFANLLSIDSITAMSLPYLTMPYSAMNLYQRFTQFTPNAASFSPTIQQAPGLLGPAPQNYPSMLGQSALLSQSQLSTQSPYFAQSSSSSPRNLSLCLPPSNSIIPRPFNAQYQMMLIISQKGLAFPVMHCIPVGPDENPGFVASVIFPGSPPIFGQKCLSEEAARESAAETVLIQLS